MAQPRQPATCPCLPRAVRCCLLLEHQPRVLKAHPGMRPVCLLRQQRQDGPPSRKGLSRPLPLGFGGVCEATGRKCPPTRSVTSFLTVGRGTQVWSCSCLHFSDYWRASVSLYTLGVHLGVFSCGLPARLLHPVFYCSFFLLNCRSFLYTLNGSPLSVLNFFLMY